MSDTNKSQFKQTLLTVLILLLFLLVSLQAWYIFKMKKQLDVLHNQQSSVQDTTANEKDMPEKSYTEANDTEKLPDEQQLSLRENQNTPPVQPQEKSLSPDITQPLIHEKLPDDQQLSLQENQNTPPVQPQDKSLSPDTTQPLIHEKLPDEQQLSLQENQNTPPVQPQDKSLSPDTTQPLIHEEPSDTSSGGQAWNPYKEIERKQHDMDRIFNRRFNRYNNRPGYNNPGYNKPSYNKPDFNRPDFQYHFSQSLSTPEIDVKENANQYIVRVNLPGADESDISVTLNGQRLNVKSKQSYKKQNKDAMGNTVFQVRQSGRFQRSITLSKPVNQNKMKTRLDNGVLTIIIPKVKNAQWR